MSFTLLIILGLLLSLVYLVLLSSSKDSWLVSIARNQSYLNQANSLLAKHRDPRKNLVNNFGRLVSSLLGTRFINELENKYEFIQRDTDSINKDLALITLGVLALFASYLISHNLVYLLLGLVLPGLVYVELIASVKSTEEKIENNLDHIIRCLKVLIIKSETPILTALELINKDIDLELKPLQSQIDKIIQRAKKSGIKKTLVDWETKLNKFQDFINLLISVHEGASKAAVKVNIDKFLDKYSLEKEEELKAEAENLQLYLMLPVVVMLIVSIMPMIDAINFYMKKTGVL